MDERLIEALAKLEAGITILQHGQANISQEIAGMKAAIEKGRNTDTELKAAVAVLESEVTAVREEMTRVRAKYDKLLWWLIGASGTAGAAAAGHVPQSAPRHRRIAMAEILMKDALLLVKAGRAADHTAAITDVAGWTDLSEHATLASLPELSRDIHRKEPGSGQNLGGIVPGSLTEATSGITLNRADGETPDPDAFFEPIASGPAGSCWVQVCIQLRREPLLNNDNPPKIVPAASAANPQYLGHASISSYSSWAGGNAVALINVGLTWHSDFAKYDGS